MIYLGFDPGQQKCGVAVMDDDRTLYHHAVVSTEAALEEILGLCDRYTVEHLIMGDQTAAKIWYGRLQTTFPQLPLTLVDERNSSLEARDRYWEMYPARGLDRLIPKGMRQPGGPIDGIVAILLIERYWQGQISRRRF
jgi:RNase H-fold protein (predicted Holliday junction resolvase)